MSDDKRQLASTDDEAPEVNVFQQFNQQYKAWADEQHVVWADQRSRPSPPPLDMRLRRVRDEELLHEQIWQLALSEAYSKRNAGWIATAMNKTMEEVVSGFLRDHPPFASFVAEHKIAGTCAQAVEALQAQRARDRAWQLGDPAAKTESQVPPALVRAPSAPATRSAVVTFTSAYISDCKTGGVGPTQDGLVKAWDNGEKRPPARDALRKQFKAQMGPLKRGRPRRSTKGKLQK